MTTDRDHDREDRGSSAPREPTAREAAALAELDRIGRRAASALLTAVDAPPSPATTTTAVRKPRRRAWVAAAAAVLVLMAGTVIVTRAVDDDLDFSSGGVEYLVPGWLPEGLAPRWPEYMPVDPTSFEGDMAVYGDGRADDPWGGPPTLTVEHVTGRPHGDEPLPEGEPVMVGDTEGVLTNDAGQWIATTGSLIVTGDAATRQQVVDAAAHATDAPAIDEDGLPPGYVELARGARDGMGAVSSVESGVEVEYGKQGVEATDWSADAIYGITVLQRPGEASAVDLVRYPDDGAQVTTVRGQRAVLRTDTTSQQVGDGPVQSLPYVRVQWLEPSGTLVTVSSTGQPLDEVLRFVESLRPADRAETQELVSTYGIEHGRPVDPDALAEQPN